MSGITFEVDRISIDFSPEKVDIKGSFRMQCDRKLHELSEYVFISQTLWRFDDDIVRVPIPTFTCQEYIKHHAFGSEKRVQDEHPTSSSKENK